MKGRDRVKNKKGVNDTVTCGEEKGAVHRVLAYTRYERNIGMHGVWGKRWKTLKEL
jgi:hypothetical protein